MKKIFHRSLHLLLVIAFMGGILTACSEKSSVVEDQEETQSISTQASIPVQEQTQAISPEPDSDVDSLLTDYYSLCGPGELVQVGFFKDNQNNISPTQLIRVRNTSDEVRRYASVVTCLINDKGWVSDPKEVVNGYENVIVFFDKNGIAHQYRIIIGGQYVEPWENGRADIISSKKGMESGIDKQPYSVQAWIDTTQQRFIETQSRQIGVDIYLDDTSGHLSSVFKQTYQFIDTNHQIEQALLTGEGYPDEVPDGFFLFATESWLLESE